MQSSRSCEIQEEFADPVADRMAEIIAAHHIAEIASPFLHADIDGDELCDYVKGSLSAQQYNEIVMSLKTYERREQTAQECLNALQVILGVELQNLQKELKLRLLRNEAARIRKSYETKQFSSKRSTVG